MQLISTAFKRQTRAWKALTYSRKSFLETQQTSEKESNAISVKEHTAHTWLHSILQHLRAVDSGSLCPLTCKPWKPQPALAEKHWTVQFFWASPTCQPHISLRRLLENRSNITKSDKWVKTILLQIIRLKTSKPRETKKKSVSVSLCCTASGVSVSAWSLFFYRQGQKVIVSLWVTAVMVSGAIFKSRGEGQPWLTRGPCSSFFSHTNLKLLLLCQAGLNETINIVAMTNILRCWLCNHSQNYYWLPLN